MRKSLNGKWVLNGPLLEQYNLSNLTVSVPGSIYNDLLKHKVIEEPFYRANETKMLDYMNYDYAYSRNFIINKTDVNKEIYLVFLGIDTISEVYINDILVKKTYNMHRRYQIRINDFVSIGKNILKVVIKSCLEFIKEEDKKNTHQLMNMQYAVKGYANIRKAHCMFGWDWGPQMPDGGIWRSCYLDIFDKAIFENVNVSQDVKLDQARLSIDVRSYVRDFNCTVKIVLNKDNYSYTDSQPIKEMNHFDVVINNPDLWYPVGYGNQPLYELTVYYLSKGKLVDIHSEKIGIRKIEIIQKKDEYGKSFTVCVNGQNIFIKGSDYIIEDNILARRSNAKTKYLLEAAINSNQNCIRVWGGAIYPSNCFYNLCDRLGILVWQDLMFACGFYNMENELFVSEIKAEIIDNVRRIHNHPSLLLICGNNENETAALNWNVPSLEYTKKWYLYQYEDFIPKILKEVAPDIFYWPSSPSSGGGFNDPNSDSMGDMHYWGVWHNDEPIENYRLYYPRLLSEFGMQSFPCMKTIKEFTLPEDRNIYSYVMERHQKNRSANQKIMNYIGSMFKYPKNLEFISYVSQLIQAEAVRYCVEHLRRNYPRCMGAIYWQLNDCWPVASWSSIDYYGRYKALQYYAKKFYAKKIVSVEENNSMDVAYTKQNGVQSAKVVFTNEDSKLVNATYQWMLVDFDNNILDSGKKEICVKPYISETIDMLNFNMPFEEQTKCVLRVKVTAKDGEVYENYASFVRDKYLELKHPHIDCELTCDNGKYQLVIEADTYAKYVCLDVKKTDVIFSDNYFNLYKGEKKIITFESNENIQRKDIKIISLTDSF